MARHSARMSNAGIIFLHAPLDYSRERRWLLSCLGLSIYVDISGFLDAKHERPHTLRRKHTCSNLCTLKLVEPYLLPLQQEV